MVTETTTTTTLEDRAIFCHGCCSDGMRLVKSFKLTHPNVRLDSIGYFNVKEKGLDKKYGFSMADLKTTSYLYYQGTLISRKNNE